MNAAIVTACFGGYDLLRPQARQTIDVEWLALTDDAGLHAPAPWTVVVAESHYDHPRMSAKWFKMLPWEATSQRYSIWIDANTQVTSHGFARAALASMHDGIALFAHPHRCSIYDEAEASLRLAPEKYRDQPILAQVEHYRSLGHPPDAGLYACGTIARDHDDPKIRQLGHRWLQECERWTYQDQLSCPVVLAELGITPGVFPHRQVTERRLANPWQRIRDHLSAA